VYVRWNIGYGLEVLSWCSIILDIGCRREEKLVRLLEIDGGAVDGIPTFTVTRQPGLSDLLCPDGMNFSPSAYYLHSGQYCLTKIYFQWRYCWPDVVHAHLLIPFRRTFPIVYLHYSGAD